MKRIPWDVEELVALINVYDRSVSGELVDLDQELQLLSVTLNKRGDLLQISHDEKYRNPAGVKMMYQNLIYIASGETSGLQNASQAMGIVYDMYQKCPAAYQLIFEEFKDKYMK